MRLAISSSPHICTIHTRLELRSLLCVLTRATAWQPLCVYVKTGDPCIWLQSFSCPSTLPKPIPKPPQDHPKTILLALRVLHTPMFFFESFVFASHLHNSHQAFISDGHVFAFCADTSNRVAASACVCQIWEPLHMVSFWCPSTLPKPSPNHPKTTPRPPQNHTSFPF